jgi:hypothetical protein
VLSVFSLFSLFSMFSLLSLFSLFVFLAPTLLCFAQRCHHAIQSQSRQSHRPPNTPPSPREGHDYCTIPRYITRPPIPDSTWLQLTKHAPRLPQTRSVYRCTLRTISSHLCHSVVRVAMCIMSLAFMHRTVSFLFVPEVRKPDLDTIK